MTQPPPSRVPDPALLDEYLALTEQLEATKDLAQSAQSTLPQLLPHQVPPPPPWSGWVLTGGRGVGKTMAGARWLARLARSTPHLRARIIAPQLSDAVNGVVLDPDSGILRADPTATFKPSGVEGVRVTWPNGSTIWCVGTPTLKDVDRLRALTNIDCLTPDTLVSTTQGLIRMDEITTDHQVLTRRGPRRVLWAGPKGARSDLYEVQTLAGRTLQGTSDHMVHTENRGWVKLAFLKKTDILRVCGRSSTEQSSTPVRTDICGAPEANSCIAVSGSSTTDLSPQVTTSTISTGTDRTTTSATSRPSLPPSTSRSMPSAGSAPKVRNHRRKLSVSGGATTRARVPHASSAAPSSSTGTPLPTGSGSAPLSATPSTGTPSAPGTSSVTPSVSSVGPSSVPGSTPRPAASPRPATDRVLRVTPISSAEPTQVYDLTVEDTHEFFANGILVHNCDLFEEAAANPQLAQATTQAALSRRGTRLPHPLWAATTTPRPIPTLKQWMEDPTIIVTRATTFDNPHTPDAYREYAQSLRNTRYYRQEILGEIDENVEGALWSAQDLSRSALPYPEIQPLISRIVIGVDPPSGMGTCGIVAVAQTLDGHLHVIDDLSVSRSLPHEWGSRVAHASTLYDALVVAETNQGGTMVQEVLRNIAPSLPLTTVTASVGKQARAEPIAMLWEAEHQSAHITPIRPTALDDLTTQLIEWVPNQSPSPDRLDAMVWAAVYLLSRRNNLRGTFHDPHNSPAPPLASARQLPPSPFRNALQSR